MFSNDKNIETIASLVEEVKSYLSLQSKYTLLNVVEKTVKLLTVLIMGVVLTVLLLLVLIFLSFALASALEPLAGKAGGFAVVGGIYFIIFLLTIIFRKSWIERPLVRILASILLN